MSRKHRQSRRIPPLNILAINGSPRKGGNTEILLDVFLKGARSRGASIRKIRLSDYDIKPCSECGGCDDGAECVISDDMPRVKALLKNADLIVMASPVFFAGVTAQMKAMIDRSQPEWIAKYVLRRKHRRIKPQRGVFLCVGGMKKTSLFAAVESPIKAFFATLDAEYIGRLFCPGVNDKGDIKKDRKALAMAFKMGVKYGKNV